MYDLPVVPYVNYLDYVYYFIILIIGLKPLSTYCQFGAALKSNYIGLLPFN